MCLGLFAVSVDCLCTRVCDFALMLFYGALLRFDFGLRLLIDLISLNGLLRLICVLWGCFLGDVGYA